MKSPTTNWVTVCCLVSAKPVHIRLAVIPSPAAFLYSWCFWYNQQNFSPPRIQVTHRNPSELFLPPLILVSFLYPVIYSLTSPYSFYYSHLCLKYGKPSSNVEGKMGTPKLKLKYFGSGFAGLHTSLHLTMWGTLPTPIRGKKVFSYYSAHMDLSLALWPSQQYLSL